MFKLGPRPDNFMKNDKNPLKPKDPSLSAGVGGSVASISDSDRIDWLEDKMRNDSDYCEIYFAGLRDFKTGEASAFQVESQPEKFKTVNAPSLREAIDAAIRQDG